MAYEPKEWNCGEYINNRDLNRMEEGIQEALAKECDCGYSCSTEEVELINTTINTGETFAPGVNLALISYIVITADRIKVVYEGVEYILNKDSNGNYGTSDYDLDQGTISYEDCPFLIFQHYLEGHGLVEMIATETAGDHTLEIYAFETEATLTECFKAAVWSLTKPLIFTFETTEVTEPYEGIRYTYSHSWQEVHDAFVAGRPCIVHTVEDAVVADDIVLQVFDADSEVSIATRYQTFDFADKNSKIYVSGGAE